MIRPLTRQGAGKFCGRVLPPRVFRALIRPAIANPIESMRSRRARRPSRPLPPDRACRATTVPGPPKPAAKARRPRQALPSGAAGVAPQCGHHLAPHQPGPGRRHPAGWTRPADNASNVHGGNPNCWCVPRPCGLGSRALATPNSTASPSASTVKPNRERPESRTVRDVLVSATLSPVKSRRKILGRPPPCKSDLRKSVTEPQPACQPFRGPCAGSLPARTASRSAAAWSTQMRRIPPPGPSRDRIPPPFRTSARRWWRLRNR